MLKRLTITIVLMLACSCSKDNCTDLQPKFAAAIAEQLECSNVKEIEADITKLVPTNCKEKQMGALCTFLVDPVVEMTLDIAVPKRWGCKLIKTTDQIKIALTAVCATI